MADLDARLRKAQEQLAEAQDERRANIRFGYMVGAGLGGFAGVLIGRSTGYEHGPDVGIIVGAVIGAAVQGLAHYYGIYNSEVTEYTSNYENVLDDAHLGR